LKSEQIGDIELHYVKTMEEVVEMALEPGSSAGLQR
jgi:hypothetical protein